jgi:primosomal replication protein N
MKLLHQTLLAISVAGVLACTSALAHHSFAAEFDHNKPVTLEGTVTKVEWQNPHTRVYLDVADSSGAVVAWELELGSPNGLIRAGWSRHTLQGGEKIVVKGFLAKDGSNLANASSILLDGKVILSETAPGAEAATK